MKCVNKRLKMMKASNFWISEFNHIWYISSFMLTSIKKLKDDPINHSIKLNFFFIYKKKLNLTIKNISLFFSLFILNELIIILQFLLT